MLIDSVEVELQAGRGGDGIVSWRREKFVPKGGPDGGDGGRGGDIYLQATHNLDTLTNFRYRKVFRAADGERGSNKRKTGASGEHLTLLVPIGTKVIDTATGQVLADLVSEGQRFRVVTGGNGGLGNVHFATATHQNPFEATAGRPGKVRKVTLELQFIADVAFIGEPNAGKSSLIKALTGRELIIAPYQFSTKEAVLAVMKVGGQSLTLVDLPGLLAGAHQGKGLGDKFLRHAERVKALVHVIDATDPDYQESERLILQELESFNVRLTILPRLVVFNKVDLLSEKERSLLLKKFPQALLTSATTGNGVEQLSQKIASTIKS